MARCRVLIADEQPVRLHRLVSQIAADQGMDLLAPASTLTDAYNLTELHQPDVIAICEEMAGQAEFMMFRALLNALGVRCILFGGPESRHRLSGSGLSFAAIGKPCDGAALLALLGGKPQGQRASGPRVIAPPAMARRSAEAAFSRCVVIGASTGGIEALMSVLSAFPADCPPTLIVQHIRADFVPGLVQRLDRHCLASVSAAREGAPLAAGQIYVAPEDTRHLVIRRGPAPRCRLIAGDAVSGHRPSVDVLFHSAALLGGSAVGVLLTGMGRDGAEGLLEIRRNGGHTIAQDKASCTVHGMPRAAVELGAALQELPLSRIGPAILQACRDSDATVG